MGKSYDFIEDPIVEKSLNDIISSLSPSAKRAMKTIMYNVGDYFDTHDGRQVDFYTITNIITNSIWPSFIVGERIISGTVFSKLESRTVRGVRSTINVPNNLTEEYDFVVSLIASFMYNLDEKPWGNIVDTLLPNIEIII